MQLFCFERNPHCNHFHAIYDDHSGSELILFSPFHKTLKFQLLYEFHGRIQNMLQNALGKFMQK